MSSVLDTIQRLFPKARITSGYRGPDHPLTKANPKSWHAKGSPNDPRAFDVAPIPGVSFDQYIGGLKNAGLNLVESIDEARNPRRHTTGPNWHIAIGDKSKMPAPIPSRRQGPSLFPQGYYGADPLAPLPEQQQPPQMMPQMQQAPQQMAQSAPIPGKRKHKGLYPGKDWQHLLRVLGDSMIAYGGGQPFHQRMYAEGRRAQDDREFEMQKLAMQNNQEPTFIRNARAYAQLPPEEQAKVAGYQDMMSPVTADVQGEDGRVVRQIFPRMGQNVKTLPQGTFYRHPVTGEWYDNPEFR